MKTLALSEIWKGDIWRWGENNVAQSHVEKEASLDFLKNSVILFCEQKLYTPFLKGG